MPVIFLQPVKSLRWYASHAGKQWGVGTAMRRPAKLNSGGGPCPEMAASGSHPCPSLIKNTAIFQIGTKCADQIVSYADKNSDRTHGS
jgi:hypothetical protein